MESSATAAVVAADVGSGHPVASLFDGLRQVIVATLRLVAAIVRFSSVTVPSTVYAILHYSLTLQLNFPSLFLLFISLLVAAFVWLRYRHLNRYERLREYPLTKDEGFNLNPDVARGSDDNDRGVFTNYLEEFLQAIRIFGFLPKEVFHELARHLQTRRLVAGDSVSLDSDSSFYIVIDGNVQVFAPLPHDSEADPVAGEDYEDEENAGFQLLNEVQSGGTLSSLFTILRLFTEAVHPFETSNVDKNAIPSDPLPPAHTSAPFTNFTPPSSASHSVHTPNSMPRGPTAEYGSLSPPVLRGRTASQATSEYPGTARAYDSYDGNRFNGQQRRTSADNFIDGSRATVGRATVDTTLAVIPATAFKRLTKKYPNAAAHIVQVILTRLSRVTFHTAHKYLGLTKEVMRAEQQINEVACHPLPSSFYEQGGIERLRQRFLPEPHRRKMSGDYFPVQPIPEHDRSQNVSEQTIIPPTRSQNRKSSTLTEATTSSFSASSTAVPRTPWGHFDSTPKTPMSRSQVGPGDLFSMTGTQDAPASHQRPRSPYSERVASPRPRPRVHRDSIGSFVTTQDALSTVRREDSIDADRILHRSPSRTGRRTSIGQESLPKDQLGTSGLRDEVMSCIGKSIGLTQAQTSPSVSVQASPFMHAQDQLHRSVFKSAFGSLSMLDAAMYDDASSMTGHSSNVNSMHHAELENEVDIRFFEAGSVLARAGESQSGLFYVIDGFLDIVVPPSIEDEEETRNQGSATAKKAASSKANKSPRRPEPSTGTTGEKPRDDYADRPGTSRRSTASPAVSTSIGNALDGTSNGRTAYSARGSARNTAAQELAEAAAKLQRVRGQRAMYTIGRGGIAGYLSSLLNSASYVDVRAKTDVYVGFLPARALERMMERRPIVMLTLCKRLLSVLSPLILHIDSALDWQQVNAGQVIYREGDPADSFYIVINGRLRSITERGGSGVDVLGEHGQGDSVGELDVITRSPRRLTLHAIRDSELAKMPMTLFNAISVRHPNITIQVCRIIAKRVRDEMDNRQAQQASLSRVNVPNLPDLGRNNHNLKTVAIVPVTRQVPVVDFANRLQQAFDDTISGATTFLNQSSVLSVLGRHAFNRMGKLKLAGWLAEQEQKYRLVMYVVDTAVGSPWTQTSIRQADCILLVGFGDDATTGEYERLLLGIKTTARKELVLLHPERSVPPGSTREWLKSRPWINAHHHVELPGLSHPSRSSFAANVSAMGGDPTAVKALRNLKAKLEMSLLRYRSNTAQPIAGRSRQSSDFARLARRLCGRSIGLVLGGGGARGCAHVGFLRRLEEHGVPVDMVGGTSIGSLVGGLYAKEAEIVSTYGRVKKFAGRMASLWRFVLDVTYPVVSYTSGFEFNRGIFKALGETHIEDMWLPFFCNTTNITWSRMEVHTSGYSWRYIRASMTLAGLLPPLVDDGNMLVDGGYLSNLPVNVMFAMGARNVFAVDVGSIDDTSPRYFGDTLSGWWVAINRYNPWSDARNIPGITDIQGRLTYAASVRDLDEAKQTPNCLYLRMPVEAYGTMEFGKFNEIVEIGYEAARKALDEWKSEGKLPSGSVEEVQHRRQRGGISARRNSV